MKQIGFIGFPDIKMKSVIIPDLFFADLLPLIDDLNELKLTLHCFWLINAQEGAVRYLRGSDLRADTHLLANMGNENDPRVSQTALEDALERAVARNTLLRLEIDTGSEGEDQEAQREDWYFMNTVKGRQTIAMIRQGQLHEIEDVIPTEARLHVDRPNIFVIYEQNIGMMTPMIAEQLRDMEKSYPPDWVQEAFEIAVSRNKRSLRYIAAILKRWETEGKDSGSEKHYEKPEPDTEIERRQKYIPDEYADIIRG